ncbi:hypothetical protein AVEN_217106-1, partial [Araneus ventricosus]
IYGITCYEEPHPKPQTTRGTSDSKYVKVEVCRNCEFWLKVWSKSAAACGPGTYPTITAHFPTPQKEVRPSLVKVINARWCATHNPGQRPSYTNQTNSHPTYSWCPRESRCNNSNQTG